MRHSTLHAVIIVTTLVTAIIHLVVLSYLLGEISPLFVLNGLGFLVLLAAWYFTPGFLAGQRTALHIVFILYIIVTIGAWVAIGDIGDPLGIFTKLDELVLLIALVMHLRAPEDNMEAMNP
jgi:integral membrane sensor domain MASE1